MEAVHLPSGDRGEDPPDSPAPRPRWPRPPRPCGAAFVSPAESLAVERTSLGSIFTQAYEARSHFHASSPTLNRIPFASSVKSMLSKGRWSAPYSASAVLERAAASFAWSKAGWRVPASASTSTNSFAPARRLLRYQKRVLLANQCGTSCAL